MYFLRRKNIASLKKCDAKIAFACGAKIWRREKALTQQCAAATKTNATQKLHLPAAQKSCDAKKLRRKKHALHQPSHDPKKRGRSLVAKGPNKRGAPRSGAGQMRSDNFVTNVIG